MVTTEDVCLLGHVEAIGTEAKLYGCFAERRQVDVFGRLAVARLRGGSCNDAASVTLSRAEPEGSASERVESLSGDEAQRW
jgi:hypothetical protein